MIHDITKTNSLINLLEVTTNIMKTIEKEIKTAAI